MSEPVLQVAAVVIVKGDAVLLVRHINSKHIEGIYGLPGGRREDNEPYAETARRELEEETGLVAATSDLLPLPAPFSADVTFKNGEVKHCTMHVFLCTRFSREVRLPAPGEARQAGGTAHELPEWVPLAEVGTLHLLPNVQEAIREGLRMRVAF